MDLVKLLSLSGSILDHLPEIWTFSLLIIRYTAFFMLVPGIGMGERGIMVRGPAIFVLSAVSMYTTVIAPVPENAALMAVAFSSEFFLGSILGLIPMMIITGFQMATQLASTTMGIGVGNLVDPTLGMQVSDLSRIIGDISIILFMLFGGHHVVLSAVAGLGGQITPGSFLISENSLGLLLDRSAHVFEVGVIFSAPVIVALLLTQFVLGLISRAVPSVNIFIVSFPLTIGIGLILTVLALPDMSKVITREITGVENSVLVAVRDTKLVQVP